MAPQLSGRGQSSSMRQDVIYDLLKGNRRFMNGCCINQSDGVHFVDLLMDDPYDPVKVKAIVISCTHLDNSIDRIFDCKAGELLSVRLSGYAASGNDGVAGSVNYALAMDPAPTVLIVLGNSNSEPIAAAMRVALEEKGVSPADLTPCPNKLDFVKEKDLDLIQKLLPACHDALMQSPQASFEKLCQSAAKLNIWKTAETLLTTSRTIAQKVSDGQLHLHGGYFDAASGRVQMLGEHPSKAKLLQTLPPADIVRTASSQAVPAEEAMAMLIAGNQRFYAKKGGGGNSHEIDFVLMQLSEGGQNPVAAILGCADSRAPIEILFDMRPGDLFVLRTAGNTIAGGKGSLIGSAEYAISHLRTKLIVVTGHTNCGAVTAAVNAVRAKADLKAVAGSIGDVLANIHDAAAEAVAENPDGSVKEQVVEATKKNVFAAVKRLITNSEIIHQQVFNMDVQVHGAVYDIFSGKVEWLGQHPKLEEIIGEQMPLHKWKTSPYLRSLKPPGPNAAVVIDRMRQGNKMFMSGHSWRESLSEAADEVKALEAVVLCGTEFRVPIQRIFDTHAGEIAVQRCLGSIAGVKGLALFSSLEYMVVRFAPKVVLILGESNSAIIDEALEQMAGSDVPPQAMRFILNKVSVSAARALRQVEESDAFTSAGREMKARQLAVEFNVLYTIEQLILNSSVIRQAMRKNGLEVHGAVLDEMTGEVDFLGSHPLADELAHFGQLGNKEASH